MDSFLLLAILWAATLVLHWHLDRRERRALVIARHDLLLDWVDDIRRTEQMTGAGIQVSIEVKFEVRGERFLAILSRDPERVDG